MRRNASAVVFAALLLAGCGQRSDVHEAAADGGGVPEPAAAVGAEPASRSGAGSGGGLDGTTPPAGSVATSDDPSAGAAPDTTGGASPDAGGDGSREDPSEPHPVATSTGTVPVEISFSAACVRPGDPLTVTISTVPRAGVSMGIGYADGQPHGAMNVGHAKDDGKYPWRIVVAPDVPPGEATALAAASTEDGEEGGAARATFLVAGPEGCP